MSRPDARFALASGTPLSLSEAGAAGVQVDLSLAEGHDCVLVWLWPGSKLGAARAGDTLTVALGNGADEPEQVLATEVVGIDVRPGSTVLTALAPTHRLGRTYVGRAWTSTTLGQVVRDLLDEAEVGAGTIDASLVLPTLHVDPHRSVWSVLHDLARRTGHQVLTTPDGTLSFSPAPRAAGGGGLGGLAGGLADQAASLLGVGGTALREGADLITTTISTRLADAAAGPLGPRTTPAGAAAWYQLEAEPDDGSTVTVLDPALRTRDAADAATSAAAGAAARRGSVASLHVTGRPGLRPGQTIDVQSGGSTTSFRVLEVRHTLDGSGYTCRLRTEAAS